MRSRRAVPTSATWLPCAPHRADADAGTLMDWFVRWFLKASLGWLTLGVTAGVAMAVHPVWTVYRAAHLHMVLLGFVTMVRCPSHQATWYRSAEYRSPERHAHVRSWVSLSQIVTANLESILKERIWQRLLSFVSHPRVAGIHFWACFNMDSRFRGNDEFQAGRWTRTTASAWT